MGPREHRCPERGPQHRPEVLRPAVLKRHCVFNQVIGVDSIESDIWWNAVCWGTAYRNRTKVREHMAAAATTGAFALGSKSDFQRSHDVWIAALEAHLKLDNKVNLHAAFRARTRAARPLQEGHWVLVQRKDKMGKRWREGPGVIIMIAGASTWVVMHGENQIRKVNAEGCTSLWNLVRRS